MSKLDRIVSVDAAATSSPVEPEKAKKWRNRVITVSGEKT